MWDCRRSQTLPKIQGLKSKLKIKYETEKHFLNFVLDYESRWRFLILPFEFGSLPILFTACALFMYQTRSPFFIYSLLPDKTGTVADSFELACDVKTFCSISLLKSEMLHLLALLCLNGLL